MVAGAIAHRDRLTGHRGFIDRRVLRQQLAVNGEDLRGSHQQLVTDLHFVDRDAFHLACAGVDSLRERWSSAHQLVELTAGAARGQVLQCFATGEHQRDDEPRDILLHREGRDHGDDREDVEPPVPAHQIPHHVDRRHDDHDAEHQVRGDGESGGLAGRPEHQPGRESDDHEDHELAAAEELHCPRRRGRRFSGG